MATAPTLHKNGMSLLQAFEAALTFWCHLKADLQDDEKTLKHEDGTLVADVPKYLFKEINAFITQQQKVMGEPCHTQAQSHYCQMVYAVVALIDDQLLNHELNLLKEPNNHASIWHDFLIERAVFGSAKAGTSVIESMERLIATNREVKVPSKDDSMLAYVYLSLIWQGFRGKLFRDSQKQKLQDIKLALIALCEYRALDIKDKNTPLITQAFGTCTLKPQPGKELGGERLAPIARWHRVVLFGFAALLLISTGLWYGLTYHLEQTLKTHSFRSVTASPQPFKNSVNNSAKSPVKNQVNGPLSHSRVQSKENKEDIQ